ncbi:MAG: hypothetical protein F6K54_16315 [Okeania sp. SIO3B5]|nr:hypothetical protein [Okeania sp. SIO3B5]NEO54508.1 hypothetical protein [Okeania sp. SIO3B5]
MSEVTVMKWKVCAAVGIESNIKGALYSKVDESLTTTATRKLKIKSIA